MTNTVDITSATGAPPVTTMASAMLFGTILFATAALATRSYLLGDVKSFQQASNPRSSPLNVQSYPSIYTLLYHSSMLGLILYYAYVCEHHPPFPHADKHYDADQFFFLTFLLFVVSAFTWKRHVNVPDNNNKNSTTTTVSVVVQEANDKTEILNRDQTEEWKGWMQFMFLLYHYYHAEEVYNSIRIMITCYVWMTGFGNFSFFYLKADFGWVRVLQMLWRLNFLVLFLCLTQGTTYILYYICLLHTYYFFMVYVVMKIGHERNYTKWWIRIKLTVLALMIYLVWDVDSGIFRILHAPFLGTTPMLGAGLGSMWEWYFRSSLDHWSTFLGMIFALNFPITSLFFRKLEAMPLHWHILGKAATGITLLAAFVLWVSGPFMKPKFEYNQTNSYYGFIPLVTYIYFRNLTPWLRNHTLELLHQIGKTTLETYLMQHHIWLTSDAKSLLMLVPGWPKVNFLLVSLLYVFLSRRLYQLTLFLRGMMLPDDRNTCFRNLFAMFVVILSFVFVAYVLEENQMLNLYAVGFVSLLLGSILFSVVVNKTTTPQEVVSHKSDRDLIKPEPTMSAGKKSFLVAGPSLLGAFLVALLGISWHYAAQSGAYKIKPLPATCADFANNGDWLVVDGCDEGSRGAWYRTKGINPQSTCSSQNPSYVWGWNETPPSSRCRFKQRDPKALIKTISERRILFVGDSITRFLYQSFRRQLGDTEAGAYDATGDKHQNIYSEAGTANVDFHWAAYSENVLEEAKSIPDLPKNPPDGTLEKRPDLVVMGGGAWDRLWKYSTDEDKKSMETHLEELASRIKHIKSLGIPVVWIVPTMTNTKALPSEEKRENINEEEMEKLRNLYRSKGILDAASFVIDGPSFSRSRISESYDGVHYPHQVYSAGAQILSNSFDWLLAEHETVSGKPSKQPGEMANPYLGMMMLCFAFFGIYGFDGFVGFSYMAALLVPSVSPGGLYQEAFSALHRKAGLPEIQGPSIRSSSNITQRSNSFDHDDDASDEEAISLIGKER